MIGQFTVPGGARPREVAFAVPGEALVAGTNTLCVRGCAEARGLLWLYRVTVEPSRICARIHLMTQEQPAEAAVCVYRTEWRLPRAPPNGGPPRGCWSISTGARARSPPGSPGAGRTARRPRSASSRR
ncbi:hypothetical protein SANTM175S_10269 [Streptomyces antimycoticus]